jgi:hypothetical protein
VFERWEELDSYTESSSFFIGVKNITKKLGEGRGEKSLIL